MGMKKDLPVEDLFMGKNSFQGNTLLFMLPWKLNSLLVIFLSRDNTNTPTYKG
jgi:hypothetical protein